MKEHQHYRQLVQRYLDNTATKEELELFFLYLEQGLLDSYLAEMTFREEDNPQLATRKPKRVDLVLLRFLPYTIAASLLLLLATGVILISERRSESLQAKNIPGLIQAAPGSNKAILTLSNGETVVLDNSQKTIQEPTAQMEQRGDVLTYLSSPTSAEQSYNSITTPRGGEYRVTLPDGTRVWLNAGSSLRYPTYFSGKERKVELTGEAFFDVAKNKQKPFLVQSGKAMIKVTGTRFNVNTYDDESYFKTTLEEGAVTLSHGGVEKNLKPGEGATIRNGTGKIAITPANVEQDLAWVNGFFQFDNTELAAIMKQIGRWYDLDIRFDGVLPKSKFMGRISRHTNLSDVLAVLQLSGVKFSMSGKTLTVEE